MVLDTITEIEFLKNMTGQDKMLDHSIEECGQCYYNKLCANVARDMMVLIEKGEKDADKDIIKRWSAELHKRWEEGKFFKLYEEERKAKRDPKKAFEEKGWIL
ncbi:MAG: hypothetical protein LAN71_17075 [Acidobacteriia bacterium]|nr:hypothetical protein [Terriglobia bacterium]